VWTLKGDAPADHPREFALAGHALAAAGGLWLLGLAVGMLITFGSASPSNTPNTNVLFPEVTQAAMLVVLGGLGAIPGVIVLTLGLALRKERAAAPFALAVAAIAMLVAVRAVATFPGPLQPGAIVRWPLGLLALALTAGLVLLLIQGFASPTPTCAPPLAPAAGALRETNARAVVGRALTRSRAQTAAVFGGALAFVLVGQLALGRARRNSSLDLGPLAMRSDVTLALQTGGGPQAGKDEAHAELLRRGTAAVPALVDALAACPMTVRELNALASRDADSPCSDWRTPTFFGLLGELGGPQAIAELRRWVRSPSADPILRDQAAAPLAKAAGQDAVGDVAALLDVPDPPDDGGSLRRRRDFVAQALVGLHATDQIPRLAAALYRGGPHGQGTREGLRALCDFNTDDGWAAFMTFAQSPDAGWRREALGAYAREDAVPAQFQEFCLRELDDSDREASGYACYCIVGSTFESSRARYPQLWALVGDPCNPIHADLLRDAVAGRPLPEPPPDRFHQRIGPGMPRMVPGLSPIQPGAAPAYSGVGPGRWMLDRKLRQERLGAPNVSQGAPPPGGSSSP
jgi:hypothetical protein